MSGSTISKDILVICILIKKIRILVTIHSLSVNKDFKCLSLSFGMRLHNQPMHFSNTGEANNVE